MVPGTRFPSETALQNHHECALSQGGTQMLQGHKTPATNQFLSGFQLAVLNDCVAIESRHRPKCRSDVDRKKGSTVTQTNYHMPVSH